MTGMKDVYRRWIHPPFGCGTCPDRCPESAEARAESIPADRPESARGEELGIIRF